MHCCLRCRVSVVVVVELDLGCTVRFLLYFRLCLSLWTGDDSIIRSIIIGITSSRVMVVIGTMTASSRLACSLLCFRQDCDRTKRKKKGIHVMIAVVTLPGISIGRNSRPTARCTQTDTHTETLVGRQQHSRQLPHLTSRHRGS